MEKRMGMNKAKQSVDDEMRDMMSKMTTRGQAETNKDFVVVVVVVVVLKFQT